ncbi:MAG: SpoIID/LytB domain-containing protein [Elusimicrobiota bacterium]|nr:MAG: SpoIID/LytB domain-containing protein [Elusimicrobiota bacterium]
MRAALAAVLLALAAGARAADSAEAVATARSAFLAGRYQDAESAWRYLSELGVSAPEPEANLALTLRDLGRHEPATAQWLKASLLEGADGFAWNQRAWSYLATGRQREAREAFARGVDRSSSSASQAEANIGLGLSYIADGKPRAASEPLLRASRSGPYAISVAAQLSAEAARMTGDRQGSLTWLRQAVETDPANFEALVALARALAEAGDNRAAWRTYKKVLSYDPKDAAARAAYEKAGRYIVGDLDAAAGVRRASRPVLNPAPEDAAALPVSSRTIRVGLFGAPDGRPAVLTRAYAMSNGPFKVTSLAHGIMRDNGRAYDQWEIVFRPENNLVEVRDASRNILFTSKTPFSIVPDGERGSVLVKSATIADQVGVDPGDREIRGALEVMPNPWGFRLVQVAPVERYLIGVVSLGMPMDSPPQALRALAVVARTAAYWAIENRPEALERCDVLDDDSTQRTIGVGGEMNSAVAAVVDTEGLALSLKGRVARVMQHVDSGGTTEEGSETGEPGLEHLVSVQDSARPTIPWRTPVELERFAHESPAEGLYSESATVDTPASSRWTRVLDGKELRLRVERRKDVGTIRHVRVAGRTSTGRVRAVEVVGADGSAFYTGRKEIEELLSPGSLRSNLFTLQPLMDGKRVARLVVWGAGTGHGLGFARQGALGQAGLGVQWREILRHYFPRLEVKDFLRPEKPKPVVVPGVGPYKRTLDFHKQPKKKK